MDFSLIESLGFGGTGLAVTLGVLRLFWNADDAFSSDFREALSVRLQNIRLHGNEAEWPGAFKSLFDTVFTSRHFSLSCFCRSAIATVILLVVITFASILASPFEIRWLDAMGVIQIFVLFNITSNIFADYISLLETRYILEFMSKRWLRWWVAPLLLIDLCVSTIIWYASLVVVTALLQDYQHSLPFQNIYDDSGTEAPDSLGVFLIGIPTYATSLMTSVWIWLFLGGWFLIRLGAYLQRGLGIVQWALPIEEKPMRSIGEAAALLTGLGFAVTLIVSSW